MVFLGDEITCQPGECKEDQTGHAGAVNDPKWGSSEGEIGDGIQQGKERIPGKFRQGSFCELSAPVDVDHFIEWAEVFQTDQHEWVDQHQIDDEKEGSWRDISIGDPAVDSVEDCTPALFPVRSRIPRIFVHHAVLMCDVTVRIKGISLPFCCMQLIKSQFALNLGLDLCRVAWILNSGL